MVDYVEYKEKTIKEDFKDGYSFMKFLRIHMWFVAIFTLICLWFDFSGETQLLAFLLFITSVILHFVIIEYMRMRKRYNVFEDMYEKIKQKRK